MKEITRDIDAIIIACDGACSGNGKELTTGGWGAVLTYKGHKKILCGGAEQTTNNIMELTAAIMSLETLKTQDKKVYIFSDSAYVVNCFNDKWFESWEKNGFINSQKKPVENRALWERLIALYRQQRFCEFVKVKGHITPESKDARVFFEKLNKGREQKGLPLISFELYKDVIVLNNEADKLANEGKQKIG